MNYRQVFLGVIALTSVSGCGDAGWTAAGIGAAVGTAVLVSGGGGKSDDNPPTTPPSPNDPDANALDEPADATSTEGPTTAIGPAGGSLALGAKGSVSVPSGFVVGGSTTQTHIHTGDVIESEIEGLLDTLDVIKVSNTTVTVTFAPQGPDFEVRSGEVTVSLDVPDDMVPASDELLVIVVKTLDENEDESIAEAITLPATFDADSKTATTQVSSNYFSIGPDGTRLVELGMALQTKPSASISVRATAAPMCKMNHPTITMPITPTKPGNAAFYPRYAMAGPYAEPRPDSPVCTNAKGRVIRCTSADEKRKAKERARSKFIVDMGDPKASAQDSLEFAPKKAHGGLDFSVPAGKSLDLLAPTDGMIVMVKQEGVECTARKKVPRTVTADTTYALTMLLDDGSKMSFRHLAYGSVSASPVGQRYINSRPQPERALAKAQLDGCWKAAPPERKGEKPWGIAVSQFDVMGKTGSTGSPGAPHLHVDWSPKASDEPSSRRNPLCILSQFRWRSMNDDSSMIEYRPELLVRSPVGKEHAMLVVKRTPEGLPGTYTSYFHQPRENYPDREKNIRYPFIDQRGVTVTSWTCTKTVPGNATVSLMPYGSGCLSIVGDDTSCVELEELGTFLVPALNPDFINPDGTGRECAPSFTGQLAASTFWNGRQQPYAQLPSLSISATWSGPNCVRTSLSASPQEHLID